MRGGVEAPMGIPAETDGPKRPECMAHLPPLDASKVNNVFNWNEIDLKNECSME